ncbi:MAG: hypothetical protein IJU64_01355 [Bacilli bacterium]|nr:hypothetical protein [Bacilli bacterium]
MNQKQLETLRKNNEESRDFVKSCFRFALMIILKDKSNKKITVTRLCNIAGVSRMAFYRNYRSVEDVLTDEIKTFVLSIAAKITTDVYENWLVVFQQAEANREDLEAIIGAGFEQKILDIFFSLLPENEESRTIQAIWLSLFYSLIIKWLKDKKPKKAEDMARLAYKYTKNIPLVSKE